MITHELNTDRSGTLHIVEAVCHEVTQGQVHANLKTATLIATLPLAAVAEIFELLGKATLCASITVLKIGVGLLGLDRGSTEHFNLTTQAWRLVKALALIPLAVISTITIPFTIFKPSLVVKACDLLGLRHDTLANTSETTTIPGIEVESQPQQNLILNKKAPILTTKIAAVAGALIALGAASWYMMGDDNVLPSSNPSTSRWSHSSNFDMNGKLKSGIRCTNPDDSIYCYGDEFSSAEQVAKDLRIGKGNYTESGEILDGIKYRDPCPIEQDDKLCYGERYGQFGKLLAKGFFNKDDQLSGCGQLYGGFPQYSGGETARGIFHNNMLVKGNITNIELSLTSKLPLGMREGHFRASGDSEHGAFDAVTLTGIGTECERASMTAPFECWTGYFNDKGHRDGEGYHYFNHNGKLLTLGNATYVDGTLTSGIKRDRTDLFIGQFSNDTITEGAQLVARLDFDGLALPNQGVLHVGKFGLVPSEVYPDEPPSLKLVEGTSCKALNSECWVCYPIPSISVTRTGKVKLFPEVPTLTDLSDYFVSEQSAQKLADQCQLSPTELLHETVESYVIPASHPMLQPYVLKELDPKLVDLGVHVCA